jgi:putative (di)nucleoside polyphosphate hydrolase
MAELSKLSYRPCVGIMLLNKSNLVFVGKRKGGPEMLRGQYAWQMPQGGIDKGEQPLECAKRELFEETNIKSASLIVEVPGWLTYDLPSELLGKAWKGKYRGQKQKWFVMRFTGTDHEIDVLNPAGGHKPEFVEWKWVKPEALCELIVPFKRPVYEKLVAFLKKWLAKNTA